MRALQCLAYGLTARFLMAFDSIFNGDIMSGPQTWMKRAKVVSNCSFVAFLLCMSCTIFAGQFLLTYNVAPLLAPNDDIQTAPYALSKPVTIKSLRACLRKEFLETGSEVATIIIGGDVTASKHVMVGATANGYKYADYWVKLRKNEGVPFIYFGTTSLRHNELAPHYARLPALLTVLRCLPSADHLIYSDADGLLEWPNMCKAADEWVKVGRPLSITWREGRRKNGMELRTHFFVVHTKVREAVHLLQTWYIKGRHSSIQDQDILNDLYIEKKWFRNIVNAVHRRSTLSYIEYHCGSFLHYRTRCLKGLKKISDKMRKRMMNLRLTAASSNVRSSK